MPREPEEPIRLVEVTVEGVPVPRMDGNAGNGLYQVPIHLSRRPSPRWAAHFIEAWNHPRELTSMHRPGIASVVDDQVIHAARPWMRWERYHGTTLQLAVADANTKCAQEEAAGHAARALEDERRRAREEQVRHAADRIKFD